MSVSNKQTNRGGMEKSDDVVIARCSQNDTHNGSQADREHNDTRTRNLYT